MIPAIRVGIYVSRRGNRIMNRMGRFTELFIFIILCLAVNSGCSRNSEDESPSSSPVSTRIIKDMTGRQVTIPVPDDIKRFAVQTSPQVLNAYAVGVSDRLCAVTNAVK